MVGIASRELLSFRTAVIIHSNPYEMGWLVVGIEVVRLRGGNPFEVANLLGRRVMMLTDHPDLSHVRWPLDKNDFRDQITKDFNTRQARSQGWQ